MQIKESYKKFDNASTELVKKLETLLLKAPLKRPVTIIGLFLLILITSYSFWAFFSSFEGVLNYWNLVFDGGNQGIAVQIAPTIMFLIIIYVHIVAVCFSIKGIRINITKPKQEVGHD